MRRRQRSIGSLALGQSQPREERAHLLPFLGRHEIEVATAVDDLPEILRLDLLQLVADAHQDYPRGVAVALMPSRSGRRIHFLQCEAKP